MIRTLYNEALETAKMLGVSYTPLPGTTLNEKHALDVIPDNANDLPALRYYGFGLKYDDVVDNGVNIDNMEHSVLDGDLFIPIPFKVVPTNEGLTEADVNTYRLRVKKTIDGKEYYLCYLKYIPAVAEGDYIEAERIEDTFNLSLLSVNSNVLTPTPSDPVESHLTHLRYVAYSTPVTLTITPEEASNMIKAVDILYPERRLSDRYTISDVMLVSGVEGKVDNIPDAAKLQAGFFHKANTPTSVVDLYSNVTNTVTIELGGMAPRAVGI